MCSLSVSMLYGNLKEFCLIFLKAKKQKQTKNIAFVLAKNQKTILDNTHSRQNVIIMHENFTLSSR